MIKEEEEEGKDGVIQAQEVEERPQREKRGEGWKAPGLPPISGMENTDCCERERGGKGHSQRRSQSERADGRRSSFFLSHR